MSERDVGRAVKCGVFLGCVVVAFATAPAAVGDIIYVDINAECGEPGQECTGDDWLHALKEWYDLHSVLLSASEGDQILVANGTYHPSQPGYYNAFELNAGVTLKGGYAGYSNPGAERDIVEYPTILSGDLRDDDDQVIDCETWADCPEGQTCDNSGPDPTFKCIMTVENSCRVLEISGSDTAERIIDGFTITAGYASCGSYDHCGGGIGIDTPAAADVVVSNCRIEGNDAVEDGAGIVIYYNSRPVIANCEIRGNTAIGNGGGIATRMTVTGETPLVEIVNCIISDNYAHDDGGGVFVNNTGTTVTRITNSLLARNFANINCAAIDAEGPVEITNCTIVDNEVHRAIGPYFSVCTAHPATITNSILWGSVGFNGEEYLDGYELYVAGDTTVRYTDVEAGRYEGCQVDLHGNLTWNEPPLSNIGYPVVESDPLFVDPGADDYRIGMSSPCIDAANDFDVPLDVADLDNDGNTTERTPFELGGDARFIDDPSTTDRGQIDEAGGYLEVVDMGAHEFRLAPDICDAVFITPSGGSWEDAPNWAPQTPDANSVVCIVLPGTVTINNPGAVAKAIHITNSLGVLDIENDLRISDDTVIDGRVALHSGATLLIADDLTILGNGGQIDGFYDSGQTQDPPLIRDVDGGSATLTLEGVGTDRESSLVVRGGLEIQVALDNNAYVVADDLDPLLLSVNPKTTSVCGHWVAEHHPVESWTGELSVDVEVTGVGTWSLVDDAGARITINAACVDLGGVLEITHGKLDAQANFWTTGNLVMQSVDGSTPRIEIAAGRSTRFGN